MICCGTNRDSKFCPECGKELRGSHSLDGLLNYLKIHAAQTRKNYERRKSSSDSPRGLESYEKKVRKWEAWRDALAKLMKSVP